MLNKFKRVSCKFTYFPQYSTFTTQNNPKYNVLFFGTDMIAQKVLESLYKNQQNLYKTNIVDRLEVVSSSDTSGNKNLAPVKKFSLEKKISIQFIKF